MADIDDWKQRLRPASFAGVPFKVKSHEATGGRRVVTHEFPLKDKPFTEDLGHKATGFTVSAYVLGAAYFDDRDALLTALDQPGSAQLVHPYLGNLSVVCTGWSLSETTDEGRVARFALTFIESGEADFPSDIDDQIAASSVAAEIAQEASATDFADMFSVDGLSDFFTGDATAWLTSAANGLGDISKAVNNELSGGVGFLNTIENFTGSLGTLIRAPLNLANQFFGLVSGVTSLFDSPLSATQALFGMFNFGNDAPTVPQTTTTRIRQQTNRDAIFALTQRAVIIQAANLAPAATYPTLDVAEQTRDTIADGLDAQMENPLTPDPVFTALQDLRTAVVDGVPPPSVALPNLTTYTPQITMPSLVIAYALYQNAGRELEIVQRNKVRNPGFVPGGESLSVLTNE